MKNFLELQNDGYIFMKRRNQLHKIWIEDIELIQADGDYSMVSTSNGAFFSSNRLKDLEDLLSSQGFLRVHRSYLINMEKIEQLYIGKNQLSIGGETSPIGKNYKSFVLSRMVLVQ